MRATLSFMTGMLCLASVAAQADTVYLIQLGSYESEQKAEERWAAMKGEESASLASLQHQSSPITVPPSGDIVYRLQAGPFASRDKASDTCAKVAVSGAECYVAESAMFTPAESDASVADAQSEPLEPVESPVLPMAEAPAESAPVQLADASATTNAGTMPWETTQSDFAAESSFAEPAVVTEAEPAPIEMAQAEPELVPVAAPQPAIATIAAPEPETVPVAAPEGEMIVAPTVTYDPRPSAGDPRNAARPAPARPVSATPDELAARAPRNLATSRYAAPAIRQPVAQQQPMVSQTIMQPVQVAAAPESAGVDALPGYAGDGEVEVSEAIQVPVSEFGNQSGAPAPGYVFNSQRAVAEFTSRQQQQGNTEKALWVQLSYFSSEAAAMGYFNQLRQRQPQAMQAIRARITRPYAQRLKNDMTSLRLGPFLYPADVQQMCAIASSNRLSCTVVRDLSSTGFANVSRYAGQRLGGRQAVNSRANGYQQRALSGYYVQLGSYSSRADAGIAWRELRARHATPTQGMSVRIEQPVSSSSAQPVYRLRTGPYATHMAAQMKCDQLRGNGIGCIVVSSR